MYSEISAVGNGKFLGKHPSPAASVSCVVLSSEAPQIRISMVEMQSLSSLHSSELILPSESFPETTNERGAPEDFGQLTHIKHLKQKMTSLNS